MKATKPLQVISCLICLCHTLIFLFCSLPASSFVQYQSLEFANILDGGGNHQEDSQCTHRP